MWRTLTYVHVNMIREAKESQSRDSIFTNNVVPPDSKQVLDSMFMCI